MVQAVASILMLLGAGAWVVGAVSLFRAIALVPKGQRLSALFASGWWQFDKVRALGGPGVDVHLQRFVWAFGLFFFVVIGGMILGVIAAGMTNRSDVAWLAPTSGAGAA